MAGTIGAMFNGALQLGSAVGIAAVTSIEASVEQSHGGFYQYHGRAAAFWFLLGVLAVQTIGVLVFYRRQSSTSTIRSRNAQVHFNTAVNDEKFPGVHDLRDVSVDIEINVATLRG